MLLCICMITFACNSKNTGNHLSPKVMRQLLIDANIAETYSTLQKDSLHKQGPKNIDSLAVLYKDVLAHYKITPEQFAENLQWYKEHPEDLDTIYNDMLPIATGMQTAITPLHPAAPVAAPPAPPVQTGKP